MALLKCKVCGKGVSNQAKQCPNCGCPITRSESKRSDNLDANPEKWARIKLIIGIISIVLWTIISLQSCAVGIGNSIENNGEIGGSSGMITALCMMIGGIIGIVSRRSMARASMITATSFYVVGSFIAYLGAGSYSDLKIWGFISFAFGYIFLVSILQSRQQMLIWSIVAVLFLFFLMSGGDGGSEAKTAEKLSNKDQYVKMMIG